MVLRVAPSWAFPGPLLSGSADLTAAWPRRRGEGAIGPCHQARSEVRGGLKVIIELSPSSQLLATFLVWPLPYLVPLSPT